MWPDPLPMADIFSFFLSYTTGVWLHPEGETDPGDTRPDPPCHPYPGGAVTQCPAELQPLGQRPGQVHLPDGAAGPEREAVLPRGHRQRGEDDAHHIHAHCRAGLSEIRAHLSKTQVHEVFS